EGVDHAPRLFPEDAHERAVEAADLPPTARADGHERQARVSRAELRDGVADRPEVLARFDGSDGEHVRRPHTGPLDRRVELPGIARHRWVDAELRDLYTGRR